METSTSGIGTGLSLFRRDQRAQPGDGGVELVGDRPCLAFEPRVPRARLVDFGFEFGSRVGPVAQGLFQPGQRGLKSFRCVVEAWHERPAD